MSPVLLDVSHTAHTGAFTGVQRVVRDLRAALGPDGVPVVFDPYERTWRSLDAAEQCALDGARVARRRGARWSLRQAWRGRLRRCLRRPPRRPPAGAGGAIVPELFSPTVAGALPALKRLAAGPVVALFHDAAALQRPEFAPPSVVGRLPGYLEDLAHFDGVAAISESSREALAEYWRWAGWRDTPPLAAIPLGVAPPPDCARTAAEFSPHAGPPVILCVSTIEGRKNHEALLEACESLWRRGRRFQLRLIGLPRPETASAALRRIESLQAAGRPLRFDPGVDEGRLEAAYTEAAFTVYPSEFEGFGLPVAESLARGRPCVCSGRGAVAEIARGGGCVELPTVDAPSLEAACERLLANPAEALRLAEAARDRRFKTPADHAREILAWMKTLPIRSR